MCFTSLGRIQTRLCSLALPLLVSSLFAIFERTGDYWTLFALMALVALTLDLSVYAWLIRYQPRWLTIALGALEFVVIAKLLDLAPTISLHLSFSQMLSYYVLAWLSGWITTQALLPLLWPRWAEDGGEFRRVAVASPSQQTSSGHALPAMLGVSLILLLAALLIGDDGRARAVPATTPQLSLMDAAIAHTRHFKGDAAAPVTIIEFGDLDCSSCAQFALHVTPQLDELYVKTGIVRYAFHHIALTPPAEASECAAAQGAFWLYHDALLERRSAFPALELDSAHLTRVADDLHLDATAFGLCLEAGTYRTLVMNDVLAARALRVEVAPTFLLNSQLISGGVSFDVMQSLIEAAREAR